MYTKVKNKNTNKQTQLSYEQKVVIIILHLYTLSHHMLVLQVLIPPIGTVTDVLASDKRFSEFLRMIKNSGLADRLNENGPFTVLAPTNKVNICYSRRLR